MLNASNLFPRGSEWRQWDFHVHTPASFQWSGMKFSDMTDAEVVQAVDQMIATINQAVPSVFVLMDYWTFDGWFALKKRLAQAGAPKLNKLVLPGIELRLVSPTSYRLNAHVVFADDVSDQDLNNFKSDLRVALIEQPLSDECLRRLARQKLGDDLLTKHGMKVEVVKANDPAALLAGSKCAEIIPDTYKTAISKVPDGKAIAFMPWDTYNGLADAEWAKHYAYVVGFMQSSPIFETRRQEQWEAFVGIATENNKKWFASFQAALGNKPHLAVSGSDAHSFADYGKFPSGKATWIKADPTFHGLLQAIMEPAKRSFIGECPQKLAEIAENKTYFIDSVDVQKNPAATNVGKWLDGSALPLNPDLIAIIGNKGSGKSALADVIALLGNSRQKNHFSFLKKDRFRGKSGEPAKHFSGTLTWCDASTVQRNLNDDPPDDKVELVRYIPQGHFEELCNDHVSGRTNAFERELRAVIFSHASEAIRLGALDFDQLIEQQESSYRDQLSEFRKDLKKLNQEIAGMEEQLQPEVKRSLQELLNLKARQIDEHNKIKPAVIEKPAAELTEDQKAVANALDEISAKIKAIEDKSALNANVDLTLAGKLKAIQNVRERMRLLERSHKQFQDDTAKDLENLGLKVMDLVTFTMNDQPLDQLASAIPVEQANRKTTVANETLEKSKLQVEQVALNAKLNAPQQHYQQYLKTMEVWEAKLAELTGTTDAPETQKGLQARISQLESLPDSLDQRRHQRLSLAGEIFDILNAQRKAREELFAPVQDLIQGNSLIRDEYKLQFQATLGGSSDSVAGSLFALIKQNSGDFRGEDESYGAVRKVAEQYDFNKRADILGFITTLHEKIVSAATGGSKGAIGIASILRKDKAVSDVYDLLFGLSFLEPRYSLLFQDTQIEQLSPGQRGALLLIFYLLVDKGRNPIILDQPEENLDNETVVSLLVPVLSEAKKKRQIIMVTHNPNLAVVCDAEQVIYSSFDRKNASKITYRAGSIENPITNSHVVNVLEGTKPAFDNRRVKYH
ncbi:MAG: ABC transporter [Gammaproteobacteria bacterium RIFOXYD12_FULL_61_37]|nr:MAG: ABC transporter [Gammaproteobacteria bacterium RIFOXYD12_FULL_61_37]